ncbi:hypothetical protein [Cryptosporidium hominis TU502]|uniref:hypothetical protein n=1 Tax=Cryptosporidium hominis (strain TU502) TaxID=353151 RepID=UPI0000452E0A|nr:hypothetical protein [Cryptosporidium hominis TU502]
MIQSYYTNYGSEISSRDVSDSFHDLDNSASYETHQQATNVHENHAHKHSTHSHSKYRGLHLISNQSDSDSSDPE